MKACTLLFHQTCVSNFTVREGFTGVFVKGRGLTGLPPKRTVDGGQTFTRTYIYISLYFSRRMGGGCHGVSLRKIEGQ